MPHILSDISVTLFPWRTDGGFSSGYTYLALTAGRMLFGFTVLFDVCAWLCCVMPCHIVFIHAWTGISFDAATTPGGKSAPGYLPHGGSMSGIETTAISISSCYNVRGGLVDTGACAISQGLLLLGFTYHIPCWTRDGWRRTLRRHGGPLRQHLQNTTRAAPTYHVATRAAAGCRHIIRTRFRQLLGVENIRYCLAADFALVIVLEKLGGALLFLLQQNSTTCMGRICENRP